MRPLLDVYRRLDRLQKSMRFRIAASVLAVVACGAVFGSLLAASYSLDGQRQALVNAFSDEGNLAERDPVAVSLAQSGTVTVNGRTYGGDVFFRNRHLLFDEHGGIRQPEALAERLLADVRPAWAPAWMLDQPGTTWLLAALATGWLVLVIWLDLILAFLITLLATAGPVLLCSASGFDQAALAIAGVGLLTFTYVLLSRGVLALYGRPIQILAVAHTVVKEASRTNLSLSFIVLLLVLLPLVPVWLDRDMSLQFQVQTFISRSMGLTFAVAACLTLVLSCATVAFEIRDRQIWQLMTKPVLRVNYLLGKWLGVVSVNLILLLVSGVSIFAYIQYLRQQPVQSGLEGELDALSVRDEVLTARLSRPPDYQPFTAEQLEARVDQVIERTPEYGALAEVPLALRRKLAREVLEAHELGQRTIPPLQSRSYTFGGLQAARGLQSRLALKYRFHILRSDEHEVYDAYFRFNDDDSLVVRRRYVPTVTHVLTLPPQLIREDGTITVEILNAYEPPPARQGYGSLNFERDDFQLMYKVGNFEPNFLRAVMVNWVKLSFLAMLGIAASTMLSFSVACLFSFTVFIAAWMGPFLAEALGDYVPPAASQMDWSNVGLVVQWAFQWFIKAVAEGLVFALRGFGEINATQKLVEGRLVSWLDVVRGVFKLGVLWSGLALLVGFLVMRSRQLAIYSGQG